MRKSIAKSSQYCCKNVSLSYGLRETKDRVRFCVTDLSSMARL